MRMISTLTALLLLLCLLTPSALAANAAVFDESEYGAVEAAVYAADFWQENPSPLLRAYKLHRLAALDFAPRLAEGAELEDFFTADYVWLVQSAGGEVIRVERAGGGWEAVGRSPLAETAWIDAAAFADAGALCLEAPLYHAQLLYLADGAVIPYFDGAAPEGLQEGAAYSPRELGAALAEAYPDASVGVLWQAAVSVIALLALAAIIITWQRMRR